ncbi:neuropeptide FF receptor 2-like isoform X2 [Actinia tenebrosa]|nr:neuropeptide FF receptor 2-like isoform X2 [Actinia tenebrosa]
MRTPMNYLLVNLAISDITLLLFFTPLFIFRGAFEHPTGTSGDVLCTFITGGTFAWSGGYTSAFFLVAIAIERYFAITRPHDIRKRITMKKLKYVVGTCWFLALAFNAIGFLVQRYNEEEKFCREEWPFAHSPKVYSALSLTTIGLIPVLTMFVLYSRVVQTLWGQSNRCTSEGFVKVAAIRNRKKVTKIVLTVSTVYTLCWLPELCVYTTSAYDHSLVKGNIAYPAAVALVTVNSAVNPLIYCFHSGRFRQNLVALICGGRRRSESLRDFDDESHSKKASTDIQKMSTLVMDSTAVDSLSQPAIPVCHRSNEAHV